jgi:ABC-2 type transport system ATP-binding protein
LGGRRLRDRISWALATAELEAVRRRLVRTLPGGLRQRLALVAALLHQPPVVFLDEPTGGVDPAARRRFWDLIDQLSEQGTTVFVTTHSMDEAERCHRVALMHAGRLLALDSVPALKALLPAGTLLDLRCPAPAAAVALLKDVPGVREAALFGDSVHVAVDRPDRVRAVRAALTSAGISPDALEPITPSLEDAFIHVIGTATGEGP